MFQLELFSKFLHYNRCEVRSLVCNKHWIEPNVVNHWIKAAAEHSLVAEEVDQSQTYELRSSLIMRMYLRSLLALYSMYKKSTFSLGCFSCIVDPIDLGTVSPARETKQWRQLSTFFKTSLDIGGHRKDYLIILSVSLRPLCPISSQCEDMMNFSCSDWLGIHIWPYLQ